MKFPVGLSFLSLAYAVTHIKDQPNTKKACAVIVFGVAVRFYPHLGSSEQNRDRLKKAISESITSKNVEENRPRSTFRFECIVFNARAWFLPANFLENQIHWMTCPAHLPKATISEDRSIGRCEAFVGAPWEELFEAQHEEDALWAAHEELDEVRHGDSSNLHEADNWTDEDFKAILGYSLESGSH